MKKQPESLSAHLMVEADKFQFYPKRLRRTILNLETTQAFLDGFTFAAPGNPALLEKMLTPLFLDDWLCRDLLRRVPAMVQRVRNLSHLELSGVVEESSLAYLREAANCYIAGYAQAAITLSRAAVEEPLRARATKTFGERVVSAADLKILIGNLAVRGRLLSAAGVKRAHRVRMAANQVLHQKVAAAEEALAVLEDARHVVLELQDSAPQRPRSIRRASPGE